MLTVSLLGLVTTTLHVRSPTPRKQVQVVKVQLPRNCLVKKHRKKQQLSYYIHINKTLNSLAQKILIRDVLIHKFHGQDNVGISRDELSTLE